MTISYKVSENLKDEMIKYYDDLKRDKTPDYALFQAEEGGTIITLYSSLKIVFQGISADIDAALWMDLEMHRNKRDVRAELSEKDKESEEKAKEEKDMSLFNISAIGSDEVGTGDFFGPIVVSASYVDKKDIMYLIDLGIKDSKKLTDDKILKIAPILIKKIPHTTFVLDNKTYNENPELNMNKMKAILHNKVLLSMVKKNYPYQKIIVDQFTYPRSYFGYLKDVNEKVTKITFTTKAEDKNLSVAVASIISRYYFLKEMDKLSDKYSLPIPKGAGPQADKIGKEFIEKHGYENLKNVAKMNFKNVTKIKEL